MSPRVSDEKIWSWVDRSASELDRYLAQYPDEGSRVGRLRDAVGLFFDDGSDGLTMPERIGPYEVVRLLGAGGMGTVYEALAPNPRRSVAVKVLRGGAKLTPRRLDLFRREADALARLGHPGDRRHHRIGADG